MANEVWEEIQEAEAKANQILEAAQQQSADVLKKAREKAADLFKKAEEEATVAGETMLRDAAQKIGEWKNEQLTKANLKIQELIALGEKKKSEAVNMIIEKVVS